MTQAVAALVFFSDVCRNFTDEISREVDGQVYFTWDAPVGVSYVLSDADMVHITTRYGVLPQDVPVFVLCMRPTSDCHQTDLLTNRWNILKLCHEVRGEYSAVELTPFCTRMNELARGYERPRSRVGTTASRQMGRAQAALANALAAANQPAEPVGRAAELIEQAFGTGSTRTPGNIDSYGAFLRNRQRHGNMVTRGQAEAAERRNNAPPQPPAWVIDWQQVEVWTSPGADGNPMSVAPAQMEPKHLWDTICWMVTNYVPLFQQYNNPSCIQPGMTLSFAAKVWLRCQPAFRALMQEAIRRHMTFPKDVFRYLKDYVLGHNNTDDIQVSVPWADPAAAYQTGALVEFLNEPLNIPQPIDAIAEFGREFRDILIE